jgi:hypothetical protein
MHTAASSDTGTMASAQGATEPLWRRLDEWRARTVAVVGMTKNTGKTVCLNHLLAQAHAAHRAVGITSIGRDGEERDQVFSFVKPPVRVTPGALVATARDTLVRAKARTRTIGTTGVQSPMGEILVVKALEHGEMEVAGASLSHDQHTVMACLRRCGADVIFLDGALGRSHHASPAIAEAVVLSTGAAIGGGMEDVLRKTRDRLAILSITQADEALAARVQATFVQGGVGVWGHDGACVFNEAIATINAAPALLALSHGDVATVAVSGAVGRQLWQALRTMLARHPGLTVVVADGTRLFIDAADLIAFEREGGHLRALRAIRLLGVTLNPFSPFGGSFDAGAFLERARSVLHPQLVTDVMLEQRTRP